MPLPRHGDGKSADGELCHRLCGDDCNGSALPSLYRDFSPIFYVGGIVLLVLVLVIGEVRMGAQRWIRIPGFGSVQPSEFMRLGMPMMCAWFMSKRDLPPNLVTVGSVLALIAVPVVLILKEPDLGTSLLIAASGIFVVFLAGLPWWMIGSAIAMAIPAVWVAWNFVMEPYQKQRVMTLINLKQICSGQVGTSPNLKPPSAQVD